MPLPSFLKPKDKKPAPRRAAAAPAAADDGGPVQQARTRARRRLIGAVVLLAIGVIGFPLIFETQPRPVALDIPIEAPPSGKGGTTAAAPKPVPAAPSRASAPVVATAPAEVIEEAPPPKTTAPTQAPAPTPALAPAPSVAAPAPKPVAPAPAPPVAKADDSSRAKALLEDSAPKAAAGRFVVQVGAFSDSNALREARQKVEKLGLKTYTQVVETEAGKRTRVRVGPFSTRDEADSAGAKLKAAGLPAAVLTL